VKGGGRSDAATETGTPMYRCTGRGSGVSVAIQSTCTPQRYKGQDAAASLNRRPQYRMLEEEAHDAEAREGGRLGGGTSERLAGTAKKETGGTQRVGRNAKENPVDGQFRDALEPCNRRFGEGSETSTVF